MAVFKKRTKSPQINLAVSMDNRTNNEALNIQEGERLVLSYVENADLYNTLSVENRNGTQDLSNGIINAEFSDVVIIDNTVSGIDANGYRNSLLPVVKQGYYDYPVQVIVPSGDMHLTATELRIFGAEGVFNWTTNNLANYQDKDFIVKAELFALDQTTLPASGVSFMTALPTSSGVGNIYDIALSGNAYTLNTNTDFYPKYINAGYGQLNTLADQDYARHVLPVAIGKKTLNFGGQYKINGGLTAYLTPEQDVKIPFSAPVALNPSGVYAIRYSTDFSGCSAYQPERNIYFKAVFNTDIDFNPNVRLGEEFLHRKATPTVLYERSAVRFNFLQGSSILDKTQAYGKIYGYSGVNFLNPDYYTASYDFPFPMQNGYNPIGGRDYGTYFANTSSASIGQTLFIPSGTNTFFGCYGYFGLKNTNENWTAKNADGTPFTSPKNIGIAAKLWSVDSTTGSGGNYEVTGKTLLGSVSGNMVMSLCSGNSFAFGDPSYYNYFGPSESLKKQYFTFDNPVTITSSGSDNYLLTFDLYDYDTNGRFYDYVTNSSAAYLPIVEFGAECNSWQPYSGVAVVDYSGNGNYKAFSGTYPNYNTAPLANMDLACGLIDVPSGNAITLLYDYRVGSDLNQKIIVGQRDKLYYTYYVNPDKTNYTTIHSGATINNNWLWSALTNNDLLFAHHYSADNGQVWASNYSGVSYAHGKRPTFTASGIGAAGTFTSGTYHVMLATSMQSGGFRASVPSGITVLNNQSIHVGAMKMEDQFPFDINDNSTYVFITENGGVTYYLANLKDAVGGGIIDQPIQNNQLDVYIDAPPNIATDENVAGALSPSYPQRYLTTQIDTPKFKKILNFYNYMIGIGVEAYPSKFYHSEILGPQIWGTAGDYHGSYDVNPDNGQQITAAEVFSQWLIIYKKNSTFKVNFEGEGGIPFSIVEISPNIGNIGIFSTVATEEGLFGLSQYGPTLCNGNGVEVIGKEILPWYKEINHDDLTFAYAVHDQQNNTITWSIGNDNENTDKNYSLVLNYKEKSWSIRQGASWNCAGIIRDADGFDEIWMGDSLGTVRRDNVGNTDQEIVFNDGNGVKSYKTIQLLMETPWMSFKDFSTVQKQFRFLNLNIEQADAQLQVDVYFDYATTPLYTRYMNLNQTGPNNRINLGSRGKVVKFVIKNVGNPAKIKINSMMIEYQPISEMRASQ